MTLRHQHRLVIGSRGSGLALVQAHWVKARLEETWRERVVVDLQIIRTIGDKLQKSDDLPVNPGKGLFTKELEEKLLEEKIDLAVHSLKDLPVELVPDFQIAAVPKRASARDVLILKKGFQKDDLPKDSVILTGSPRRMSQWLETHPHTRVEAVRGNIDTRLKKLATSKTWVGMILAEAGLERLCPSTVGLTVHPLDFQEMLPAPAQGALGIEIRKGDERTLEIVSVLHDELTGAQVSAERAFLQAMGGGCLAPIAAYAEPRHGARLRLHGVVFSHGKFERHHAEGLQKKCGQIGWLLAQKFSRA